MSPTPLTPRILPIAKACHIAEQHATSPAAKLNAGINDFTADECIGVAGLLCDNVFTLPVYQALMDFALGIKVPVRSLSYA